MNATSYQVLAEDHVRILHREAEAVRRARLAQQASKAAADDRIHRPGSPFEIVRRLVARLATA